MQKTIRKVALILFLCATVFIAGAGWAYYHKKSFLLQTKRVDGTVVDIGTAGSGTSRTYYPIVKFKLETGEERTIDSGVSSDHCAYKIGETVQVFYDPKDPADALLGSFWNLWLFTFILTFLGALATFLGGFFLFMANRFVEENNDNNESRACL